MEASFNTVPSATGTFRQCWPAQESGAVLDLADRPEMPFRASLDPKPEPEDASFQEAWNDTSNDDGGGDNALDYISSTAPIRYRVSF